MNSGVGGKLTGEAVAAYISKYATKAADDLGVGITTGRPPAHIARLMETGRRLARTVPEFNGMARWEDMLFFGGHFSTKSRRYSTTLGAASHPDGRSAPRPTSLLPPGRSEGGGRRLMGSVVKVKAGYRARWRTPDGGSRSKRFRRKLDAESHVTAMEHSKLEGAYIDPAAGKVRFMVYAEQRRESQVHRPGTANQVESNLRRHVYPRISNRSMRAIRQSEIQALVKAMVTGHADQAPLAPATVGVAYDWVATIFKAAVADRVIAISPCRGIKLPQVDHSEVTPLAMDVVECLVEGMPQRYRAMIGLGIGSGVRISEALGLTNDRVDWLRRSITVDRQLVGVKGGLPIFGPVKDKRNRPRVVPVPDVVMTALSVHVGRYGLGPESLVFTGGRGGPLRRSTFSEAWGEVARPLGIPLGDGFHQLRHFYASALIRAGESVKVVQKRLGHRSAQITLDVYGHLWPEDDETTGEAVQAALGTRVSRLCHGAAVGE